MAKWRTLLGHYARYYRSFHSYVDIVPSVSEALANNKPVVALETTIVTHGMPYPSNEKTAFEVEEIVKEHGAVPATIGVINGRIKVGMNRDMLTHISQPTTKKIKISRRDFPYVLSERLTGGTTVCGTLLVTKMVGIDIFVTGGIGGVHRDVNDTMDISADLYELSRNSTMVVCAGIKSILDIGRTLEFLETCGVCVVTYGDSTEFPAFYSRRSGYESAYRVSSAEKAAELLLSSKKLRLESGILLGVPIPEEHALIEGLMEVEIEQALKIAKENGIRGKVLTPFLLEQITEATAGKSLESNIALIKNNARIGSQIAVEFSKKKTDCHNGPVMAGKKSNEDSKNVTVIGGAMLDVFVCIEGEEFIEDQLSANRSQKIMKGRITPTAGGVGRNIADAIGKMRPNNPPYFIGVVGNDDVGRFLWNTLKHVNRDGFSVIDDAHTASYLGLLQGLNGSTLAIHDMDTHGLITAEKILEYEKIIADSSVVVFDGNLSTDAIDVILQMCKKYNSKVWFEPTDWNVVQKPFEVCTGSGIDFISPNFRELQRLVEYVSGKKCDNTDKHLNMILRDSRDLALQILHLVPNIIVTLGKYGLLIVKTESQIPKVTYYRSIKQLNRENVFGVGDCLVSGYIVAMLNGLTEHQCVSAGMHAAFQSLVSSETIPRTLQYRPFAEMPPKFDLPLTGEIKV